MMHIHLFDTIFAAAVETPNYTPHSRALMSLDWSFTSPVCTPSSVPTKPASPFQPIDWMTDLDFPVMDESSDEGDEVSTDFIELLSMATGWRRDEALLQRRARRVEENPAEAEIVRAFQQLPLDMAQRHHRRYRRQGGDCPVCGDAPGGAACLKFARIPFCDCFVCRYVVTF
jgi:hypothetical protein